MEKLIKKCSEWGRHHVGSSQNGDALAWHQLQAVGEVSYRNIDMSLIMHFFKNACSLSGVHT